MQLTYRGSRYTVNSPAIATQPTEQEGIYRGNRYRLKMPASMPTHPPTEYLRYRGVLYLA
jgi:hypothetical protein